MPEVRNAFWRERVCIVFLEKSKTIQAPRDGCDAKAIVRRYQSTGIMEHLVKMEPRYGDFTNVGDYLESMTKVRQAQEGFDALPAEMRDRCDNDPGKFVEFMNDPENAKELHELGLGKLSDELHGPLEKGPGVQLEIPGAETPEKVVENGGEKPPDQIDT